MHMDEKSIRETDEQQSMIEGRNAVREAFRAGSTIDRLYVQEGLKDGPVMDLIRRAKKADAVVDYVTKERLDRMSETGMLRRTSTRRWKTS